MPAEELGPPHGRLTEHADDAPGPRQGYRVPHARAATGVGALYTPGTTVLIPDWRSCPAGVCRFSTTTSHSLGSNIPSAEGPLDEASTRVQAIHPSGLPLARHHSDGTSSSFGFPPSFAPRRPGARRRTSRVGTGHRARTRNNALRHRPSLQSNVVHSWCATSRRTDRWGTLAIGRRASPVRAHCETVCAGAIVRVQPKWGCASPHRSERAWLLRASSGNRADVSALRVSSSPRRRSRVAVSQRFRRIAAHRRTAGSRFVGARDRRCRRG